MKTFTYACVLIFLLTGRIVSAEPGITSEPIRDTVITCDSTLLGVNIQTVSMIPPGTSTRYVGIMISSVREPIVCSIVKPVEVKTSLTALLVDDPFVKVPPAYLGGRQKLFTFDKSKVWI
jgi:hypothetical protein